MKTRRSRKWKNFGEEEENEPREIIDTEKARRRTFERAVNLLAYKWRSVAELRERLLEKDWTNAEIVDSVIERLEEYGYLNDERFAHDFAASQLSRKPVGKRVLLQKLAQKKISKETADAALEQLFDETSESELIERAVQKRLRLKGRPETREDTKKFYDYLLRQGFSYEAVREKMREIAARSFDDES
jgi:Uncharacterized protein conserved in bacteria